MRKAFLVGINNYKDSKLNGCVNDVLLIYRTLSEKFDFNKADIDIITDEQATKKNILNGLKKLTTNLKPNDTIVFHYSGHGSQVVSNDWTATKEADGRDEILCSIDLDWKSPIRDNDLNNIFANLKNNAIVLLDCCHSGTGLRNSNKLTKSNISDVKSRFLAPPIENILSNPKISLDENLKYVFPEPLQDDLQTQLKKIVVSTNLQGNTILLTGCGENQTSADAYIGNRYHGAFTYSLCQILSKVNYSITYKSLVTEINKLLKKVGFEQISQLESREELQNQIFLNKK